MDILNQKPLSEIKEEKEMKQIEIQADVFEVIVNLYEEVEGLRAEIEELKNTIEGGAK